MQLIKTLYSSVLHRSLKSHGRFIGSFSVGYFFRLTTGDLQFEPNGWGTLIKNGYGLHNADEAVKKQQGEFIVLGKAYAPNQMPAERVTVSVKCGNIQKSLLVSGPRDWQGLNGTLQRPRPFTEQEISYKYAFGGEGFNDNPVGIGAREITNEQGDKIHPIPHIEYPHKAVTRRGEWVPAASFNQVQLDWTQRQKLAGTYDDDYLKNDMPGLARDLDWRFFQIVASDQWNQGFWRPDERFSIANMHPTMSVINSQLPGVIGRCFVSQKEGDKEIFKEIPLELDTIWFLPDQDLGLVFFRGTLGVADDFMSDIKAVMCALESVKDTRRSFAHYEREFKLRMDPQESYKYLLFQAPLLPEGFDGSMSELTGPQYEGTQSEFADAMKHYAEAQQQQSKDNAPEALQNSLASTVPPPGNDDLMQKATALIEQAFPQIKDADGKIKGVDLTRIDLTKLDDLKKLLDSLKDQRIAETTAELKEKRARLIDENPEKNKNAISLIDTLLAGFSSHPPLVRTSISDKEISIKQSLDQSRQRVNTMVQEGLATEAQRFKLEEDYATIEKQLQALESSSLNAYRKVAHYHTQTSSPHAGREAEIRNELVRRAQSGQTCQGMDLSFCDLSGLNLSGLDFSGAFFEYALLKDTRLAGANLENAVFCFASIKSCDLSSTNMKGANLGSCSIATSDFRDARMDECVFAKSSLTECQFSNAQLHLKSDAFLHVSIRQCQFEKCNFTAINLVESALESSRFMACDFSNGNIVKCSMPDNRYENCVFAAANIVSSDLSRSRFECCNLQNIRFVGGCKFPAAVFHGSDFSNANLRDCEAMAADFSEATARMTDFGNSNLEGARFDRFNSNQVQMMSANLKHSSFKRANLFGASFMNAVLTGCDFTDASLYSVNFMGATLGGNRFAGADLTNTLLKDWRPA